jgi:hypothetical protein
MHRMRLIPCGLLLLCAAATAVALAGPRDDVLARVRQCGSLADDAAWLDCYRAAAAPMAAAIAARGAPPPTAAPAPTPVPTLAPAAAPKVETAAAGFGIINRESNPLIAPAEALHPPREPAASEHITAHLSRYSFTSQNYFVLVLDNGQVWQQINGDDEFAVLRQPASQYEVTIKHGLFGSYNLTISGAPGLYRVHRIS